MKNRAGVHTGGVLLKKNRIFTLMLILIALIMAGGCGHYTGRYDGEDPQDKADDDGGSSADDDDDDGPGGGGTKIGNFTWTTDDGGELTLYDYEGSVIILTVGAGWCEGCKEETPILEEDFWQVYEDDGLVVIQLLTEDTEGKTADTDFAQWWRSEFSVTFPICIDPDWTLEPYFTESTLPFTMLINRELIIKEKSHGFESEIFKALVEQLL